MEESMKTINDFLGNWPPNTAEARKEKKHVHIRPEDALTVIHGKGTGTLREVVRKQLARHPLVESYRPGEYGEGGAGVTIAILV